MKRRTVIASAPALAAAGALVSRSYAQSPRRTLRVWGSDQLSEPTVAALWAQLKADFEAMHPGVTIEYVIPTGTISNGAVQAAIQSDAGPDVVRTNSGPARIGVVVNSKLVLPLTQYYGSKNWQNAIAPWLYDLLKTQFGGEIYEVPDTTDAIGIWYHKDIFAQNGWAIGGTYTEFLDLMGKIKASGVEPIASGLVGFNGGHLFGNLLQSAAGSDVAAKVVTGAKPWTDAGPLLAATRLRDLVTSGYISPAMTGMDLDGAVRLWTNKRAAMIFAGPWILDRARKNEYPIDNLGVATIPSDLGDEESLLTGGVAASWIIPVSSRQPELAAEWIGFIMSDGVMRYRAKHPSHNGVLPRDISDVKAAVPVLGEVFALARKGVGYNPSVYIPGSALDTYYQVLQGIVGGQVSPRDGLALVQSKMTRR